jgi:hypothetical protein
VTDIVAMPGKQLRRIITSHSLDNVFDYCPRKFEFLSLYDKRPARESGYAAMIGDALHDGTQSWLIARQEGASERAASERAFVAMCKRFPWDLEDEQPTSVRSFNATASMLYTIIRSPEWDDWELLYVKDKGWAVEVPFLIEHVSLGPVFVKARGEHFIICTQGKIDLIMRHKRTGRIRSVDIKTTAKGEHLIRSNYTFSGQQTGYSHVVHAMAGVAPTAFQVVYAVCLFNAQELPALRFVEIDKDESEVDDYWLDKIDRLNRMKSYAEAGRFPRTNGECNSWNHECSMFDICHSRDPKLIQDWFDFEIESEPVKGYDYWVRMEL